MINQNIRKCVNPILTIHTFNVEQFLWREFFCIVACTLNSTKMFVYNIQF